jgi:type I restriction enzyme R subunit
LVKEDSILNPPEFVSTGVMEPEYDFLSEIINQVNNTYGVNLTEEDRLDLSRLSKRLIDDPEVHKYMNGDNTEDNKQSFFKQQFEGMMVDFINERFDFYKKMDDNPSMKNLIFQMMYKDYQTQRFPSIGK